MWWCINGLSGMEKKPVLRCHQQNWRWSKWMRCTRALDCRWPIRQTFSSCRDRLSCNSNRTVFVGSVCCVMRLQTWWLIIDNPISSFYRLKFIRNLKRKPLPLKAITVFLGISWLDYAVSLSVILSLCCFILCCFWCWCVMVIWVLF